LRASRRSPSRPFCFQPNSGRPPCKPGRRNIWQSQSLLCLASFCVSRTRRNQSRSNPETKPPARRTSEQYTLPAKRPCHPRSSGRGRRSQRNRLRTRPPVHRMSEWIPLCVRFRWASALEVRDARCEQIHRQRMVPAVPVLSFVTCIGCGCYRRGGDNYAASPNGGTLCHAAIPNEHQTRGHNSLLNQHKVSLRAGSMSGEKGLGH
jgi:hypothetical protein